MISDITLTNFKAHSNLKLGELPLITVLVGRNNTGKSAILHAAALPRYGPTFGAAVPIGEVRHLTHRGASSGSVEIVFKAPPATWTASFGAQRGYSIAWKGRSPDAEKARLSMFYISATRQPAVYFNYIQSTREVGPQGEQTWNVLHQLKANDDQHFPTILEWSRKLGMGISSIGTPTVNPGSGEIAPESYGHRANLLLHGSGTWSVLPIIVQGVLAESDETLLIEEPEIHLHRGAMDALWGFLGDCASRGIQTICTTHSLDFLVSMNQRIEDKVLPKDSIIMLLKREANGDTAADKLDPKVFRNIKDIIKKELSLLGV
ncbi:MAG TPA: AAA family ATPase [Thermoplasmata archaeon]|nr:AAA family ATPase [Thermoplasmata archaeon]